MILYVEFWLQARPAVLHPQRTDEDKSLQQKHYQAAAVEKTSEIKLDLCWKQLLTRILH